MTHFRIVESPVPVRVVSRSGEATDAPKRARLVVASDGRVGLSSKPDWHTRPIRVHDVPVTFELDDGSTVEGTVVAFGTRHAGTTEAIAARDVFGMYPCLPFAADVAEALSLVDELARIRTLHDRPELFDLI